jgi:hypothetical protein
MRRGMIEAKDRSTIRELGKRWTELASQPVMGERKRLWKAVHDLKAERPVIMVETSTIEGFVSPSELRCADSFLRGVEQNMLDNVRHAEEVGDDIVLEPYYRIAWQLDISDYGVPVEMKPATTAQGEQSLGYSFNFPIKKPGDIEKLKKRTFAVERERTLKSKALLEDIMGDILPIKVANYDPFSGTLGNNEWTGNFFFGLTWQIFRFIGNDGLLYWLYDAPDAIHRLMEFMYEDRISLFEFLEREKLIEVNSDNQMAGPRSYGYVSDLPAPDFEGPVRLEHLWGWAESQEATIISPTMYEEFVLPYLARLSERFGLVYYGCCEPVDDRLERIVKAIPNLRSVSVSGWADFKKVGEMLGKNYVYSRKPTPSYMSGAQPDWELMEKDMKKTYAATRDCNLEILVRDLYTIDGDRPRLRAWVDMTKAIFHM